MLTTDADLHEHSEEIANIARQIKGANRVGLHKGNYGLRHYLSEEQKELVYRALLFFCKDGI